MSSQKDVTIYDIAKVLDLSPATVSRGLKDHPAIRKDTRKKIKEKAIEMGYQHNLFARNLRAKKTNTIGVIVPRLNSYFMATVISGMEKIANQRGYTLIISQSQENIAKEVASVNAMYGNRVDGLMVSLSYDTENLDHFDVVLKKKIPLIFFDRVVEHPQCTSIVIDNVKAGYDATLHLLDQGCRRVVYIGGSLKRNVYADRLKGCRLALLERGIPLDDQLQIIGLLNEQSGLEAARQIIAMPNRPDGIFVANDTAAVACLQHLKQGGLSIPEDVAIIGFNNDPISRVVEPNLSTINYPGEEMGEIAASTLINSIERVTSATLETLVLRHQLIVRASSTRMAQPAP